MSRPARGSATPARAAPRARPQRQGAGHDPGPDDRPDARRRGGARGRRVRGHDHEPELPDEGPPAGGRFGGRRRAGAAAWPRAARVPHARRLDACCPPRRRMRWSHSRRPTGCRAPTCSTTTTGGGSRPPAGSGPGTRAEAAHRDRQAPPDPDGREARAGRHILPTSTGATGNTPDGKWRIRWKALSTTTWLGSAILFRTMTFKGNQFAIRGFAPVPPLPGQPRAAPGSRCGRRTGCTGSRRSARPSTCTSTTRPPGPPPPYG